MSHFPITIPHLEMPFFDGCERGVLRLQFCPSCQSHQFYPRLMCQHCWGRELEWIDASGKGCVKSFTVVRVPLSEDMATPYAVVLVQLTEGPTMMSRLQNYTPEKIHVGAMGKILFEPLGEWPSLPLFELDDSQ